MSLVLWAVAAAGVVHVVEEFGWPGGFLAQLRRVAPRFAGAATPRFAVAINGLMLALYVLAPLVGRRLPGLALSAAALALVNGLVHVGASVRARGYAPGLVSGAVLYLPLGVAAYASFARAGLLSARTLLVSLLLGLAWQLVPLVWLALALSWERQGAVAGERWPTTLIDRASHAPRGQSHTRPMVTQPGGRLAWDMSAAAQHDEPMRDGWDVLIVGAGPAGLFAARELALRSKLRVLILEMGPDLPARLANPSLRTSGFGGAGAFSDGKLTLSPSFGGRLGDLVDAGIDELIADVDQAFLELGAPRRVHGGDLVAVAELAQQAEAAGMTLLPARIRHVGTDRLPGLLERLRSQLPPERVTIRTGVRAEHVAVHHGRLQGLIADGHLLAAPNVLIAPGRAGADWVDAEATRLGIPTSRNLVDIGVRVECPATVTAPLTDPLHEFKLKYRSPTFGDSVRTFCVCPHGEVTLEPYDDVVTVNGHSYTARRTANTNFAVLVTTRFTEPFREPIAYGRHVARLANMLGGSAIVQRLGDLLSGRRSTPERIAKGAVRRTLARATPGDLAFVLPYRYLTDILELLRALETLTPGLWAADTLLYGVEAKFYSAELALSSVLETPIPGLFAAGDGAGVSRGLVQAAASGVVAARAITARTRPDVAAARTSRTQGADRPPQRGRQGETLPVTKEAVRKLM